MSVANDFPSREEEGVRVVGVVVPLPVGIDRRRLPHTSPQETEAPSPYGLWGDGVLLPLTRRRSLDALPFPFRFRGIGFLFRPVSVRQAVHFPFLSWRGAAFRPPKKKNGGASYWAARYTFFFSASHWVGRCIHTQVQQ